MRPLLLLAPLLATCGGAKVLVRREDGGAAPGQQQQLAAGEEAREAAMTAVPQEPLSVQCVPARRTFLESEIKNWNAALEKERRSRKYQDMSESAFQFFTATAHLFYRDASTEGWVSSNPFNSENTSVWIQGNMHLRNLGAMQDAKGEVVMDVVSFDEAYVASYLYDVYRLATSLVLVAQCNGQRSAQALSEVVNASFAAAYLKTVEGILADASLRSVKLTADNATGEMLAFLQTQKARARADMLTRWVDYGKFRLPHPKNQLEAVSAASRAALVAAVGNYSQMGLVAPGTWDDAAAVFTVKDVALRLRPRPDSRGANRYFVLLEGVSKSNGDDIILELQEQGWPSIHAYAGDAAQAKMKGTYGDSDQGLRVAVAAAAMGRDVDGFVGSLTFADASYSVRQLDPVRGRLRNADLDSQRKLSEHARQLGALLARAHARSDVSFQLPKNPVTSDFPAALRALTEGKAADFQANVLDRAVKYASQVNADYACFQLSFNTGNLK